MKRDERKCAANVRPPINRGIMSLKLFIQIYYNKKNVYLLNLCTI